jgi:ribosomal protein S20
MKSAGKLAVILLLSAFVVGCKHKTQAAPPPAQQAPILPPSSMNQSAPPPQLPPPEAPQVNLGSDQAKIPPPPPPKHPKKKPSKPSPSTPASGEQQSAQAQTPPSTTQQASTGQPSEISPIGQLSTAGDTASTVPRQKVQDQITSTEKGLNGITKRSLSSDEQATVTQIRTFLEKAKQALAQDDLDGAQTLLTKAKLLLDELTKQ